MEDELPTLNGMTMQLIELVKQGRIPHFSLEKYAIKRTKNLNRSMVVLTGRHNRLRSGIGNWCNNIPTKTYETKLIVED